MKHSLIPSILLAACVSQGQSPLGALDALKLAAKNRPSLRAAKLGIEEARSSSKALEAFDPLEFGVGASSRSDVGTTDQDLYLRQPIDLFGRQVAARRLGEAGVRLAGAAYAAQAGDLQRSVLTAYAESVAAAHRKEVANELLLVAEGLLAATRRRFEEGKIAELQVTRATIEFQRAKQAADLRETDLRASLERLAGELGIPRTDLRVESDGTIAPLADPTSDSRADLLALGAQVEIAEAEERSAITAGRPTFELQLVRTPWDGGRGAFVGRAQLSWVILDHGRSRNETKAARQRAEAARGLLADATARARSELAAAQIELAARQGRVQSCEALIASARDLVAKSQRGFIEGFGTQIDVLEATRALREVEQELVDAKYQLSLAAIAQYGAAGYLAEVLR